jgi:hypothetical protein
MPSVSVVTLQHSGMKSLVKTGTLVVRQGRKKLTCFAIIDGPILASFAAHIQKSSVKLLRGQIQTEWMFLAREPAGTRTIAQLVYRGKPE